MASNNNKEDSMDIGNEKSPPEDTGGNLASGEPQNELADSVDTKTNEAVTNGDTRTKRQIKKDDSGISVEKSENSSDEEDASKKKNTANGKLTESESTSVNSTHVRLFPKLKSKAKNRNYRVKKGKSGGEVSSEDEETNTGNAESKQDSSKQRDGRSSPDSGHQEGSSALDDVEMEDPSREPLEVDASGVDSTRKRSRASESEDSDSAASDGERKTEDSDSEKEEDKEEITPRVLLKQKPKHKWFVMQEVVNRQKGVNSRYQGAELFQQRCYGSLHCVQRLELMYKLQAHHGCVNALHFNSSGSLLASGSDDLSIVVWDWPVGKFLVSYDSGHRSNVFQAKFLPLTGDTHLVSCGRDGQIRLAELSSTGVCRSTRRLAQHKGPAHKIAVQQDTPHVFLSSGEDAVALSLDVREPKPQRLVQVKDDEGKKIALYSIHCNPLNNNEFCVCGRDHYVRIYDKRKISDSTQLKKFCPRHLAGSSSVTHVTCAVFNYNGTEILGSYNDEDIYLFDTRNPDGSEFIHRYEGHRNNATVKGVSFFGSKSEYIVSGSDCGNIFFWDKGTEAVVQWMPGDENGVVNCLEPHPQIPILATSGLDDDVKIWVPSCEKEPKMEGLKSAVISNHKSREDERNRDPDGFDGQMLWILWRHIRRTERRRAVISNSIQQRELNSTGVQMSGSLLRQLIRTFQRRAERRLHRRAEHRRTQNANWSPTAPFSCTNSGTSVIGQRLPPGQIDQDSSDSTSTNSSDSEDAGAQRVQCSPS